MYLKAMSEDRAESVVYQIPIGESVSYGTAQLSDLDDRKAAANILDDEFVINDASRNVRWASFVDDGDLVLVITSGQMFTMNNEGKTLERIQ